jgi:hypothetical protein
MCLQSPGPPTGAAAHVLARCLGGTHCTKPPSQRQCQGDRQAPTCRRQRRDFVMGCSLSTYQQVVLRIEILTQSADFSADQTEIQCQFRSVSSMQFGAGATATGCISAPKCPFRQGFTQTGRHAARRWPEDSTGDASSVATAVRPRACATAFGGKPCKMSAVPTECREEPALTSCCVTPGSTASRPRSTSYLLHAGRQRSPRRHQQAPTAKRCR